MDNIRVWLTAASTGTETISLPRSTRSAPRLRVLTSIHLQLPRASWWETAISPHTSILASKLSEPRSDPGEPITEEERAVANEGRQEYLHREPISFEVLTLSERDSQRFVEALLNPPAPSARLRRARARYRAFIGEDA